MRVAKACQRSERRIAWGRADGNLQQNRAFNTLEPIDTFRQRDVGLPQDSALWHAINKPTHWVVKNERTTERRTVKGNVETVNIRVIAK
jgi:hypothetical protein